jgi:hypothetical protein
MSIKDMLIAQGMEWRKDTTRQGTTRPDMDG